MRILQFVKPLILLSLFFVLNACNKTEKSQKTIEATANKTSVSPPDWTKNMVMYEVNIRNFSEPGSFKAFEEHLPAGIFSKSYI